MRIGMIGTGYVGLVSAACLSEFGHDVVCVDKDAAKIAGLKKGHIPIFEPGLDEVVAANVKAGRLSFTGNLKDAVAGAEAVFIAVGTPSRRGDGHADLSYVFAAAEEIASALTGYAVIVTKSTVPVGTSRKVEDVIRKARPDAKFDVASNPEFLREGSAIEDFMKPDRVVVGCGYRAGARSAEGSLSSALPQRDAHAVHGTGDVRTHQIRGERVSRDQDHVHQRDGGYLREGRCRCAGCGARHRSGWPHWREIPPRRPRLRRLVLSCKDGRWRC